MITYRSLAPEEIDRELFSAFIRHQEVTRCWRKIEDVWQIRDIAFIDDWSEADYAAGIKELQKTILSGGFLTGAFSAGKLKGFAAVEPAFFGSRGQYLDLSNLHVSEDMRRCGIGRTLFFMAADWAKKKGAEKLYISAHSAVESQAFYRALGCIEAEEYNEALVEKEPCDCQMEYRL